MGNFAATLTIKLYVAEYFLPTPNDIKALRSKDVDDFMKPMVRDVTLVVTDHGTTCTRYPYLCVVFSRDAIRYMYMDGFRRKPFICPEINKVRTKLKNPRH